MSAVSDFSDLIGRNLAAQPGYAALQSQLEAFYFLEADLLDNRRYRAWLDLLADDLTYYMPMRANVPLAHDRSDEFTTVGEGIHWFENDKWTVVKRVEQIETGIHYAEEPLSRITHMISNVRIVDAKPDLETAQQIAVTNRFLLYQNRIVDDTTTFVGRRHDRLRHNAGTGWQVHFREVIIEQGILQAKNITNFL